MADRVIDDSVLDEDDKKKFRKVETMIPEGLIKDMGLDIDDDDDDEEEEDYDEQRPDDDQQFSHIIRVGNKSKPHKLAYHIVKCLQKYEVAETQSIGPVALSKAILAIVVAESIVSQYTTCEKLCIIPCIRKPKMRNGEEKTALRLRVVPVHIHNLK